MVYGRATKSLLFFERNNETYEYVGWGDKTPGGIMYKTWEGGALVPLFPLILTGKPVGGYCLGWGGSVFFYGWEEAFLTERTRHMAYRKMGSGPQGNNTRGAEI